MSLWGKSRGLERPYPLAKHLLDTASWAALVWDCWLATPGRGWATDLLGDNARRKFQLLAGLHDLGKADAIFQHQLNRDQGARPEWLGPRILGDVQSPLLQPHTRHEAMTGTVLADHGCPLGAAVLSGHHGRWPSRLEVGSWHHRTVRAYRSSSMDYYGSTHGALVKAVLTALELDRVPQLQIDRDLAALLPALAGAITVADWLASDERFVRGGEEVMLVPEEPGAYLKRRWEDAEREADAILGRPVVRRGSFSELFPGLRPRGVQTWTDTLTPTGGLTVVMVPPGEGKTEAALQLHSRLDGEYSFFFGLPTTATADAMFDRVHAFYGAEQPTLARLAHGRAALHAFYDPADAQPVGVHDADDHNYGLTPASWFRGRHRALAAPVTVGTCDQALAAALSHRYVTVRLASLSAKHVVLDEVHTYDPYQQELLYRLLGYLGAARTPVTLLSATLPTEQLRRTLTAYTAGWHRYTPNYAKPVLPDIAPYPGVVTTDRACAVNVVADVPVRRRYDHRIELVRVDGDRERRAEQTANLAADLQGRVGVVVNTVDRALLVARLLLDGGHDVVCLHSRMPAGQREAVTHRILALHGADSRDARPPVLVATQVVETSLDIDFDHLVTDLAPATSLVQRSGRQWRHSQPLPEGGWQHPDIVAATRGQHQAPVMHVLGAWTSDGGRDLEAGSHLPYSRAELRHTSAALRDLSGILRVPEDVQALVDRSYVSLQTLSEAEPDDHGLLDDVLDQVSRSRAVARRALDAGVDAAEIRRSMRRGEWEADPVLHRLTSGTAFRDDAVTRLAHEDSGPTQQILLLDPAATTPYAFAGKSSQAEQAQSRDNVLAVLRAVVPVGGGLGRRVAERVLPWEPKSPALCDLRPVLLDDVTDLVRLTELGLERVGQEAV